MRHPSDMASRASVAAGRPSTRTPPSPPARARRTNTGCASAAFRPRPWRPSRGASSSRSPASGYPGRARSGGSATAAAIAAQSVVLPAPAGTVRPCSAAGGLFEAERRHRRWSRSRSVLPPAAPSTLRTKARSHSRSYQRLAGTLHLASRCEATDPVHHGPVGTHTPDAQALPINPVAQAYNPGAQPGDWL